MIAFVLTRVPSSHRSSLDEVFSDLALIEIEQFESNRLTRGDQNRNRHERKAEPLQRSACMMRRLKSHPIGSIISQCIETQDM